jgi:hypothetical protein
MGAIQATSAANPSADAQAQRDRSVANDAQDGLAAMQPARALINRQVNSCRQSLSTHHKCSAHQSVIASSDNWMQGS